MKVFCAKCKAKKEITNVEEVFATKSCRIIKGTCTGCNKEIHEILEKKKK